MTSRERVMTALMHKEPDRIPLELGSTWNSTITLSLHKGLEKYFGKRYDNYKIMRWIDTLVFPDEDLLKEFQIDCRSIYTGKGKYPDMESYYNEVNLKELKDGSLGQYNSEGILIWKKPAGSCEFQQVGFPLGNDLTKEKVNVFFKNNFDHSYKSEVRELAKKAKLLRNQTNYSLIQSNFIAMVVTGMQQHIGFEDWYVNLALNTKELQYATEKYLEKMIYLLDIYFSEVGPYIDITECLGDDMADQRGPSFSMEQYVKIFKPMHKRLIETVKRHTDAKIMFHICGAAYQFIPHLIDIGVDIINPVQVTAAGMDPIQLKREFGRELCFFGGIDTQNLLPFGTKEEVAEEVKRMIDILGKDGGYVFAPCHDIQAGTPIENIVAMYKTAIDMF